MNTPIQDWDPLVIRRVHKSTDEKLKAGELTKVPKSQAPNSKASVLSKSVLNDFDPENVTKPATSTREIGLAIQQARMAKSMSQADLDKKCSFPKGTVQAYENGTAIANNAVIAKMETALDARLPRLPKKK